MKSILLIVLTLSITLILFIFRAYVARYQSYGYSGAFIVMLVSNSTVLLPVPGLFVIYGLGASLNIPLLAVCGGTGAALGELTGYVFGMGLKPITENSRFYKIINMLVRRFGGIAVVLLAAIPNPVFDLVSISAGLAGMKWYRFFLYCLCGKIIQSFIVGYAGSASWKWLAEVMHTYITFLSPR